MNKETLPVAKFNLNDMQKIDEQTMSNYLFNLFNNEKNEQNLLQERL